MLTDADVKIIRFVHPNGLSVLHNLQLQTTRLTVPKLIPGTGIVQVVYEHSGKYEDYGVEIWEPVT